MLDERFGPLFDVGPAKALVAQDPVAEMQVLASDYLDPMQPRERARRMGRMGIVQRCKRRLRMRDCWICCSANMDGEEYTGENDPFRVDFGFRVGRSLKMFHVWRLPRMWSRR